MKILIDDTPGISLNEIRAKARRVKIKIRNKGPLHRPSSANNDRRFEQNDREQEQ